MKLPYTICFCRCSELVLMLYRNRQPHAQLWNGIGGKIQNDETPWAGVHREVQEESGLDLNLAEQTYFAGIVTWPTGIDPTSTSTGMYAFVGDFPATLLRNSEQQLTPEGLLDWKPVSWVCDAANKSVVENIPFFLPKMFTHKQPVEFYCDYVGSQLRQVIIKPLPADLVLV